MTNLGYKSRDIIKGEIEIINDEIGQFNQTNYTANLSVSMF